MREGSRVHATGPQTALRAGGKSHSGKGGGEASGERKDIKSSSVRDSNKDRSWNLEFTTQPGECSDKEKEKDRSTKDLHDVKGHWSGNEKELFSTINAEEPRGEIEGKERNSPRELGARPKNMVPAGKLPREDQESHHRRK